MADILLEFEQRIAAKRKELEEEERALAVLKRSMGLGAVESATQTVPPREIKQFRFEDLGIKSVKKRTLTDEVRDVVQQFGDNEFTVAHVEAALKQIGVVIDAKSPRARISLATAALADEGVVVKTMEGSGNVPNRYKLKSAFDADSLA